MTNKSKRLWIGAVKGTPSAERPLAYELFWAIGWPTEATHGDRYTHAIGPFRTKAGATFMADRPGSPTITTVAAAERAARREVGLI